jgi:hypothetical protein
MSIYEILPALDLTQSVHDKICIRMHRRSNFKGTGYDYPDLSGLCNNNEKLGLLVLAHSKHPSQTMDA